ncbi:MAG: chromosome partitioning protein [Streptosporangiales bacterium]|nr:chromosome partitioning protein [Streptosporangiales bacterium]
MSIPVVTAIADARAESELVATLGRGDGSLQVVRRCVDVADLAATAQAGLARAALVSAGLRRLDRDVLGRLAGVGVAVVGVVAAGDEAAERQLRQLGLTVVTTVDADAAAVHAAVRQAMSTGHDGSAGWLNRAERSTDDEPAASAEPVDGRVIAVWGPTGAPGRSSVATGVAAELADQRVDTLLVDADTYGGSVAQALGLLDEAPGLAAAVRHANAGSLDVASLRSCARQVGKGLNVLTGLTRPDRWPELGAAALDRIWELARTTMPVTVVDCGFCLEEDEELSYDTVAPRRNAATLSALAAADDVLAVCAADALGVQRFVRGYAELTELVPAARVQVVATKVRPGPVGAKPEKQVAAALQRYAGVTPAAVVPDDRAAYDKAMARGRTLAEVAPRSPARAALRGLASRLAAATGDRPAVAAAGGSRR